MSRKVFTAGEVLAAADVNSFLMDQTVMSFAGTAARGSAISSPVEGMYTHLEDTDSLQFWNGSAWKMAALATGAGLVHLRTTTFTGVTSVSLGSNADPVFSSEFDNYKVVVSARSSTNADKNWTIRIRANTTDETASVYNFGNFGLNANGSTVSNNAFNSSSLTILNNGHYAAFTCSAVFDIINPFGSKTTNILGNSTGVSSEYSILQTIGGSINNTTSYNGFTLILSSGNFTDGVVSVYGYRKA
jgi:hypothetical protein